MLYIERIVLHNFKSFKHASIAFKRNFNCIVGANGSGKSNICDSLLFALGENSLRRLRIASPALLLNEDVKRKNGEEIKRAYVKIVMGGEANVEIVRFAREDRKMGYRLDGRRVTKQEVVEFLKSHGGDINETNTIAQGEILRLLNMNGKERRELIELAAGISEFDKKRESAEKELERAELRLDEAHAILNERRGFLNELKKEKEDAEKYKELYALTKSLTFSILSLREDNLTKELETYRKQLSESSLKKDALKKELLEIGVEMEKLSSQKNELVKQLDKHSIETSSANSAIERIKRELAVNWERLSSAKAAREKAEGSLAKVNDESSKSIAKNIELEKEIKAIKAEIDSLKGYEGQEAFTGYADIAERYSKASSDILSFEEERAAVMGDIASLENSMKSIEESIAAAKSELGVAKSGYEAALKDVERFESLRKAAIASRDKALSRESGIAAEIAKINWEIGRVNEESIRLREQIALHGGTGQAIAARLKEEIGKDFHGRAYELCNYDESIAAAVSAASGNRLGYFVVKDAKTASAAIEILKRKMLGRASFIPIEEIVQYGEDKPQQGIKPIMNFIKFDQKYAKVFNFIFSNTYVVDSIEEAKRKGIGRKRYVTLDGDLVESTGVISGGRSKGLVNPIMLESQLASMRLELSSLSEKISGLESDRKAVLGELAKAETDLLRASDSLERSKGSCSELKSTMSRLDSVIGSLDKELGSSASRADGLKAKADEIGNRIEAAKEGAAALKARMGDAISSMKADNSGRNAEKAKNARGRLEELKLKGAAAGKEAELLKERITALEREGAELNESIKGYKLEEGELAKARAALEADRADMEKSMSSKDSVAKELYSKISACEKKLADMGFKSGSAHSEAEKLERAMIEVSGKISQAEVRIGDIRAEKRGYDGAELIEGEIEQLEQRLGAAKSSLATLGSVNMKAPEMYEERYMEVKSAEDKLATIGMEKASILDMINEIESRKSSVFAEVFDSVNSNFKKIYSYTNSGDAEMKLDNPKNPFESGLHIIVSEGGRKRSVEALSGGEKSFVLIMLIFAIQMRNPMSFYIFDEIDSALDKENSKKLSLLLKKLGENSQFIVVSHNDSLIAYADTVIGVAKAAGVSKAVGIEVRENGAEKQEV